LGVAPDSPDLFSAWTVPSRAQNWPEGLGANPRAIGKNTTVRVANVFHGRRDGKPAYTDPVTIAKTDQRDTSGGAFGADNLGAGSLRRELGLSCLTGGTWRRHREKGAT